MGRPLDPRKTNNYRYYEIDYYNDHFITLARARIYVNVQWIHSNMFIIIKQESCLRVIHTTSYFRKGQMLIGDDDLAGILKGYPRYGQLYCGKGSWETRPWRKKHFIKKNKILLQPFYRREFDLVVLVPVLIEFSPEPGMAPSLLSNQRPLVGLGSKQLQYKLLDRKVPDQWGHHDVL